MLRLSQHSERFFNNLLGENDDLDGFLLNRRLKSASPAEGVR
jgi:hypothetical protein